MRSILLASALAIASFATQLLAHEIISGSIEVIHPTIVPPFPGAKSAVGYMAISNEGEVIDRLLGVESDIAIEISVHRTEIRDNMAYMIPVPVLDIQAKDIVNLEPGGVHVMFMGLDGVLGKGQMIPATLVFEKAGRVLIEFLVEDIREGQMDHSTMDDN